MFKKIKDRVRGARARARLCAHLVNLGVDAELVEKESPEDVEATSLFTPFKGFVLDVGNIRVTGKEINLIQVTEYFSEEPPEIDYAVKGQIEDKEESVTAKTEARRKGLFRKQAVDFTWIGGEIADLLNKDQSLKELILEEQMLNYSDIEIKPDTKRRYVGIHTRGKFPSEKLFEGYNTIAKHIRKLLL